jgi:hypothetical protein
MLKDLGRGFREKIDNIESQVNIITGFVGFYVCANYFGEFENAFPKNLK